MKSLATVMSSALLLAVSCTTVPVTGRKSLNLVGEGTVNQLGAQTYQQEVSKAKVSTDQNATAMVQRVAQRIAQAAEANFHPNYQGEAKLLDDPKTVHAGRQDGGLLRHPPAHAGRDGARGGPRPRDGPRPGAPRRGAHVAERADA